MQEGIHEKNRAPGFRQILSVSFRRFCPPQPPEGGADEADLVAQVPRREVRTPIGGGNEGEGVDGHGRHRRPGALPGAGRGAAPGRSTGIIGDKDS